MSWARQQGKMWAARVSGMPVDRAVLAVGLLLFGVGLVGVVTMDTLLFLSDNAGSVRGVGIVRSCPDTGRSSGTSCNVEVVQPLSLVGTRRVEATGWFDSMHVGESVDLEFDASGETWVAGGGGWLNRGAAVALGVALFVGGVAVVRSEEPGRG
jgi:hypothetical protein